MSLLEQLKKNADEVFTKELKALSLTPQQKDRLEALRQGGFSNQLSIANFNFRCQHAESLGFQRITPEKAVESLMGQLPNRVERVDSPAHIFEWVYNHVTNTCDDPFRRRHLVRPIDYSRTFLGFQKWICRLGTIDNLGQELPYGVALRLLELRKLKLFNAFYAIAPIEAWINEPRQIDPVIMAGIWQNFDLGSGGFVMDFWGNYTHTGQVAYFFVAQW